MSKELAKGKESEIAILNDGMELFDTNEITGRENVTASDLLIPRITILQKLSPQIDETASEYIDGAKPGDFCDVALGRYWHGSLPVLPCSFAKLYIEWKPNRGGFVKSHGMSAAITQQCKQGEKGSLILPNGNLIVETMTFYVLNLSARLRPSFIPFTSTGLKHARRWNTLIDDEIVTRPDGTEFHPPIWYRTWVGSPMLEKNDSGSWYGWKIEPGPRLMDSGDNWKNTFAIAQKFAKDVNEGILTADMSKMDDGTEERVPF